jgi:hypothetical protein
VPPALADLDYKIRAASLRWCVAEWAREEIERILAGEQPTGLDLGKLQSKVTPEAVQEWRSQHPEPRREPPYTPVLVRLWEYRAARYEAELIGAAGLEPATFGPPDRRANQAAPRPVVGHGRSQP